MIGESRSARTVNGAAYVEVSPTWETASYCAGSGSCVELNTFRTARASAGGDCVECGSCRCSGLERGVAVRDSKNRDGGMLMLDRSAWNDLLTRVKSGALDL